MYSKHASILPIQIIYVRDLQYVQKNYLLIPLFHKLKIIVEDKIKIEVYFNSKDFEIHA